MIDQRTWLSLIAATTQDECRQIGEMFLSFADAPRDAQWRQQFASQIAGMPAAADTGLVESIRRARLRVTEEADAQRATGWHPDQMRAELERLGYSGEQTSPA